jgi:hypothetical protein
MKPTPTSGSNSLTSSSFSGILIVIFLGTLAAGPLISMTPCSPSRRANVSPVRLKTVAVQMAVREVPGYVKVTESAQSTPSFRRSEEVKAGALWEEPRPVDRRRDAQVSG